MPWHKSLMAFKKQILHKKEKKHVSRPKMSLGQTGMQMALLVNMANL